jgi:hypothetical protein
MTHPGLRLAALGAFFLALNGAASAAEAPAPSAGAADDSGLVDVVVETSDTVDAGALRAEIGAAIADFAAMTGTQAQRVNAVIRDSGQCFRTGYDFESKTVAFCKNSKVVNYGLDSIDVIDHETFHSLLCGAAPEACTKEALASEEAVSVQEGLADLFAYRLHPDPYFGEDFYVGKPFIREYQSPACYSLTEGPHAKASALTSYLITNDPRGSSLPAIIASKAFSVAGIVAAVGVAEPCLSQDAPGLAAVPLGGVPASQLNRYRLPPGGAVALAFTPNAAFLREFPGFRIQWENENGGPQTQFGITGAVQDGLTTFTVRALGPGFGKVLASVLDNAGRQVGVQVFYFEAAPPSPAP